MLTSAVCILTPNNCRLGHRWTQQVKCSNGKNALEHAKLNKRKAVIQMFEDWLKEDEDVVETQAMKLQREAKEHHQAEKVRAVLHGCSFSPRDPDLEYI